MRGPALVIAVAALVGCGDNVEPTPTVLERHGIRITVAPSPPRLEVVRLADGEIIFDGLPGGAAGSPAAPRLAVAFRRATARIETQVGAFKIDEDPTAPWIGVHGFGQVVADDDAIRLVLSGPGGAALGAATISIGRVSGAADDAGVAVTIAIDGHDGLGLNRTSIAYGCDADEHFLGLGGQSFDVDHRGQVVPLWVEEDGISKRDDDQHAGVWFLTGRRHATHTPMPMMLSSRGFAAAVDTDARAVFALCAEADAGTDVVRLEAWDRRLALHLFVAAPDDEADDPAVVLRRSLDLMTAWVGRHP